MSKSRLIIAGTGAATALGLMAIVVVGGHEGLVLKSYRDVVGVWTACYGETKDIRPGMKFTKERCDEMLLNDGLARHEQGMRGCLNAPDQIPDKTYVAMVSFTYNVGIGAFCKSTVARRLNNLDYRGACDALLAWNKAGGRVIKGLTIRRKAERKLCMEGLAK
jgi:lysozyme